MGNSQSQPPPLDPSLIYLNASTRLIINKHIEIDEMRELARQLARHDCLTEDLFFHSTPLDTPKMTILLLEGLIKNTSVKTLDLSNAGLTTACAKLIGQYLLHNSTLESLILADNQFTTQGITIILRALEHNTTLTHLDCARNPITDPSVFKLTTQVHTRAAVQYQKRDIDHTISLHVGPQLESSGSQANNSHLPNKGSSSTLSTSRGDSGNNRSQKGSLHNQSNAQGDGFQAGQVIVVTATPTLSLNSSLQANMNLSQGESPRERRRSRTGSKIIEDLPSVATILASNPSSPHEKPSNPSSRATPSVRRDVNGINSLHASTGGLHASTGSVHANNSNGSGKNSSHTSNDLPSPTQTAVFSQEDDDEALSYLKPRQDPLNISTTGSDSPLRQSGSKNVSPSVKFQKGVQFQTPNQFSRDRSDHGEDGEGEDEDDEEWYMNNADYRRSTTNLGFLLGGGNSQVWDMVNDAEFRPNAGFNRNKLRIRNLNNLVIEEGDEMDEDAEYYYDDNDYYDDEDYDSDQDDDDGDDGAVDRFFKKTLLAKHGVTIEPFQTGYNVSQTVVAKNGDSGKGEETAHDQAGLDLLSYLTLDFEYFGTAQVVSNISPTAASEGIRYDDEAGKKKKKKGAKGKKAGTPAEDVSPSSATPTKAKKANAPDQQASLQRTGSADDKKTIQPTTTKKGKKSTLQFHSSDEELPSTPTHEVREEVKVKKTKKSSKQEVEKPEPEKASKSTPQHDAPPPPPAPTSTPAIASQEHTVFEAQPQEDNNGTLTSLINQFLHENNSEANALPNFGRMCKLYRKLSITIDRYGHVLLYYFNFSQLCRLLPRLIISLYESEFPGEQIDPEYGQIEWFSTPQQAIALHSMIHYHESIDESELFQLSLTCCKVPLTLTPYDGAEYINFYREIDQERKQQHDPNMTIHSGYKLWNSGVAFNLYSWWTKEGCKYTNLAEIEPIADSIVFAKDSTPSTTFDFPTLESRMSLDFSRLSTTLQRLPSSGDLRAELRHFTGTPGSSSSTSNIPSTSTLPIPSLPQNQPRTPSQYPQRASKGSFGGSDAPIGTPEDLARNSLSNPSISFNRTQRFKTLDKKGLNKLINEMSATPPQESALGPSFKNPSALQQPQQQDSISATDLLLPSVASNFGQDTDVQPGTQPRSGAVKNSPFLAFDQTNPSALKAPLTIPTHAPQPKPTTPIKIDLNAVPRATPPSSTTSIQTPTKTLTTPKFKRYKTYQLQLDTIDDGTLAHGINTPQHGAPTPTATADPKLDEIRQRLTISRMASLTSQLQTNSLLPVEAWVLLARQPNHVIPPSQTSIESINALTSSLSQPNDETKGKLRKEPRLSTLLLHLHLVFPNPSSPTGRYPVIDALSSQPSPDEIKRVYKKVSLVLHPDRLVNKHPSIAQLGTECFTYISAAFKRFIARHDSKGGDE